MVAIVGIFEAEDGVIGIGRILILYLEALALTCIDGVWNTK
jgi:hypothetical protein